KDLLDAIKLPITKSSKASPSVTENPYNNTAPEDHSDQPNHDLDTPPHFYFQKFSDAVPADDPNVKNDTNQRTVQVIDIPLGMKAHTVRASISHYGDIESIKLVTRDLFQYAFIIYKSAISAITFVTYWGTYILCDAHCKPRSYAEAARSRKDDKSCDHDPSAKANGDNSQRQLKSQQLCTTSSSSNLNESLSPHARELRAKNSNIPSISDPVVENTASSSSSLTESQETPVDIEALKKESSETRSLTNTCVNILKQMQSYMGMDNPDDTDPENFEDYDRDGDGDEIDNMDEDEFNEDGYLLNPTDDAINKLTEN
ncbi:hypothetical protein C1645_837653, partial [Glomus cerebriforme]